MTKVKQIAAYIRNPRIAFNFLLAVFVFFLLASLFRKISISASDEVTLNLTVKTPQTTSFMIYYQADSLKDFSDNFSQKKELTGKREFQVLKFEMPANTNIRQLRLDLDDNRAISQMEIQKISLKSAEAEFVLFNADTRLNYFWMNEFISYDGKSGFALKEANGAFDPFMISEDILQEYTKLRDTGKGLPYSYPLALVLVLPIFIFITFYREPLGFMRSFYTLASCMFMILLLLPFFNEVFGITRNYSSENRILKPKPVFDYGNLLNYPKLFEEYYNDNFGFRSWLVEYSGNKKYQWFGTSSSSKVAVGKDGWLFLVGRFYGVTQDLTRQNLYSERELEQACFEWENRKSWLNSKGIKYVKAFSPDKYYIYPEYMPLSMRLIFRDTISRSEQAMNFLARKNSPVHIVDMRRAILAEKQNVPVYHAFDSHWNSYGAFIGYTELLKEIQKELPAVRPHSYQDYKVSWNWEPCGDLAVAISLNAQEWAPAFELRKDSSLISRRDVSVYPPKTEIILNEKAETDLTVLIYRDSFTTALIPFLKPHFKKMILIWDSPYSNEMVEKVKPHLVIENYASRYFR